MLQQTGRNVPSTLASPSWPATLEHIEGKEAVMDTSPTGVTDIWESSSVPQSSRAKSLKPYATLPPPPPPPTPQLELLGRNITITPLRPKVAKIAESARELYESKAARDCQEKKRAQKKDQQKNCPEGLPPLCEPFSRKVSIRPPLRQKNVTKVAATIRAMKVGQVDLEHQEEVRAYMQYRSKNNVTEPIHRAGQSCQQRKVNELKKRAIDESSRGEETEALQTLQAALILIHTGDEKIDAHWNAEAIDMLINMAVLYERLGEYKEAIARCKNAYQLHSKNKVKDDLGRQQHDLLIRMLAQMAKSADSFGQRRNIHGKASAIKRKIATTEDPTVKAKLYEQALNKLLYVLAIEKEKLGKTHPEVANTSSRLAALYIGKDSLVLALQYLHAAVSILKISLGEKHPLYGIALHRLAMLYHARDGDTSDRNNALDYYQQAVTTLRVSLGDYGDLIGCILNNMAVIFTAQGQYDSAIPTLGDALSVYEKAAEKRSRRVHPAAAQVWRNLGKVFAALEDWEVAVVAYNTALDIILGDEEGQTCGNDQGLADVLEELANVTTESGAHESALSIYEEALIIRKATLREMTEAHEDCHLNIVSAQEHLANILQSMAILFEESIGNFEEALLLYSDTLKIRREIYEVDDSSQKTVECAYALTGIGSVYVHDRKYKQAIPVLVMAVDLFDKNGVPCDTEICKKAKKRLEQAQKGIQNSDMDTLQNEVKELKAQLREAEEKNAKLEKSLATALLFPVQPELVNIDEEPKERESIRPVSSDDEHFFPNLEQRDNREETCVPQHLLLRDDVSEKECIRNLGSDDDTIFAELGKLTTPCGSSVTSRKDTYIMPELTDIISLASFLTNDQSSYVASKSRASRSSMSVSTMASGSVMLKGGGSLASYLSGDSNLSIARNSLAGQSSALTKLGRLSVCSGVDSTGYSTAEDIGRMLWI